MTSFEQILEKFGPDAQIIRNRMKGFTEREVLAVMQEQGVKRLPKLYRELLLMAGHSGGISFIRGRLMKIYILI